MTDTPQKDPHDELSRALAMLIIAKVGDSLAEMETVTSKPVPPALILRALTLAMVAAVPSLFNPPAWAIAYRKAAQSLLSAAQQAELLDSEPEGGIN